VIGSARDLGLTSFVTLHHFTNPAWFAGRGGWAADEAVEVFGRYALRCCDALGDLLEVVNTINEPQVVAAVGHVLGYFPPRKTDVALGHKVTANLVKAHAAAVEAVREATDAEVGIPLSIMDYVAVDDTPEAKQFRDFTHWSMVGVWLEALRSGWIKGLMVPDEQVPGLGGNDDFVGVQYYTKFIADPSALSEVSTGAPSEGPVGPGSLRRGAGTDDRVTQMGWVWHPEGLGKVIDEAAEIGLPVYVTENGIATDDDEERIEYIGLHLGQVAAAIERGADVQGYFYWSYLDNFEWNEGYRPKFGLIAVDRKTFERTPKPSLTWYGGVAKANGF
jgi:beta-glucosidase